ncbi:hypothetical protein GCM10022243_60360 [Saccharothrix violaceirubra]|uniref:Uncharacterized membrane protein YhaH (DUF805 family) n=1 Tax=Saccharothrix violaceirubra TaxID=413306 RepID=A0A7W7WYS3_9PSEU|nr:hypothetical protein [Saccharothrix violaceirubra]MBB4968013.1 uncharacterized membrane protein YhaH (DUF805 family) [Saccharothrix violaceirubra]
MAVLDAPPAATTGVRAAVVRWHRPLIVYTASMVLVAVASAVGILVDDRQLLGESVWFKPFKFGVSLAVYGPTLAWLISLATRGGRVLWWMGTVTAAMGVGETVLLLVQVVRGVPSHFNAATPFDTAVFAVMGLMITVFWSANLVVAVVVLRQRFADRPVRWALRLGLLIALAGMAAAFFMTTPTPDQMEALRAGESVRMIGAHSVGTSDGSPGMPLTHWSTVGGDLRVPHFFGIHALQVVPAVALAPAWFARRTGRLATGRTSRLASETTRTRLTVVAALSYAGVFVLVLWQALRGQPLVHPDTTTLVAAGALAAVTGIGIGIALRTTAHD